MNNEIANRGRGRRSAVAAAPVIRTVAVVLIAALLGACGKRGAPLAPLNLMPEPPSALTGKRVNATVYVQMIAPKRNANGPGVVALDHLEVYAVTLRPGLMIPANRELLRAAVSGRTDRRQAAALTRIRSRKRRRRTHGRVPASR